MRIIIPVVLLLGAAVTLPAAAEDIAILKVAGKTVMIGQTAAVLRTLEPAKPLRVETSVDPQRPDDPRSPILTYHYDIEGKRFALVVAVREPGPSSRVIRIVIPPVAPPPAAPAPAAAR